MTRQDLTRQEFELTPEEATRAKSLTGSDIPPFWKEIGEKYGFDPKSVRFVAGKQNSFTAESLLSAAVEVVAETYVVETYDYNSFSKEYALVVTGDKEGQLSARIEQWKEQFGNLAIKGENDKAGYLAVTQAISQLRTTRNLVEQKRKELKTKPLELGKLIDKTAKDIIDALTPLEDQLKAEKERIDAIKEEQKAKKQLEIEKKYNERVSVMTANGMAFTGMGYKLNDLILGTLEIKSMTDAQWDTFVPKLEAEWAETRTRQLKEQAEKERLEKEAEIEKNKTAREGILRALGFYEHEGCFTRTALSSSGKTFTVSPEQLLAEEAEWVSILQPAYDDLRKSSEEANARRKELEAQKEQQEQEEKRQQAEKEHLLAQRKQSRIATLNMLGYIYNYTSFDRNLRFNQHKLTGSVIDLDDENWKIEIEALTKHCLQMDEEEKGAIAAEESNKKAQELLRQQAEAERVKKEEERKESLKSDVQKLLEFADKVEHLNYPVLLDEKSNAVIASALGKLAEVADDIRKSANSL